MERDWEVAIDNPAAAVGRLGTSARYAVAALFSRKQLTRTRLEARMPMTIRKDRTMNATQHSPETDRHPPRGLTLIVSGVGAPFCHD